MKNINLIAESWKDYELIDSGDNNKLERYGKYIISRPETQAIWNPACLGKWEKADATFRWINGKGGWSRNNIPADWRVSWQDNQFALRLTSFKHTGIFPEQAPNWEWSANLVDKIKNPQVLNLFGYTGVATIVAAKHGARVTHVDASKQSNEWAKENARLSGADPKNIRHILDDALRFSEREVRREVKYDGIILDPPAFGRGAKGEVWRIEENLLRLLLALKKLLNPKPGSFFLLNGYAAGYSPLSLAQLVQDIFPRVDGEYGELRIPESSSKRFIPEGIYTRFVI
ncbi:MAG: class I SAM-dependent methyltransferase [Candidatus Liptonbacteria bacterium]